MCERSFCRICRSGDESGTLHEVCSCKGSHAPVHQDCIYKWVRRSKSSICEICLGKYKAKFLTKNVRKRKKRKRLTRNRASHPDIQVEISVVHQEEGEQEFPVYIVQNGNEILIGDDTLREGIRQSSLHSQSATEHGDEVMGTTTGQIMSISNADSLPVKDKVMLMGSDKMETSGVRAEPTSQMGETTMSKDGMQRVSEECVPKTTKDSLQISSREYIPRTSINGTQRVNEDCVQRTIKDGMNAVNEDCVLLTSDNSSQVSSEKSNTHERENETHLSREDCERRTNQTAPQTSAEEGVRTIVHVDDDDDDIRLISGQSSGILGDEARPLASACGLGCETPADSLHQQRASVKSGRNCGIGLPTPVEPEINALVSGDIAVLQDLGTYQGAQQIRTLRTAPLHCPGIQNPNLTLNISQENVTTSNRIVQRRTSGRVQKLRNLRFIRLFPNLERFKFLKDLLNFIL